MESLTFLTLRKAADLRAFREWWQLAKELPNRVDSGYRSARTGPGKPDAGLQVYSPLAGPAPQMASPSSSPFVWDAKKKRCSPRPGCTVFFFRPAGAR